MNVLTGETYIRSEGQNTPAMTRVGSSPLPMDAKGAKCDWGWTGLTSKCYIAINRTTKWQAAEASCVARGGHLATVTNSDDKKHIF